MFPANIIILQKKYKYFKSIGIALEYYTLQESCLVF